jgi:hypothetical protein
MIQEIEMTDKEQLDMYMKLSKKELCIMLIEANKNLKRLHIPFVMQQSEQLLCKCGCPKNSVGICSRTDCDNIAYYTTK